MIKLTSATAEFYKLRSFYYVNRMPIIVTNPITGEDKNQCKEFDYFKQNFRIYSTSQCDTPHMKPVSVYNDYKIGDGTKIVGYLILDRFYDCRNIY